MSYLTEVSTKSQDWQKRLSTLLDEVDELIAAPGESVREALPRVMAAAHEFRAFVHEAHARAKFLESSMLTIPQEAQGKK
jgi:hypothetical protein